MMAKLYYQYHDQQIQGQQTHNLISICDNR